MSVLKQVNIVCLMGGVLVAGCTTPAAPPKDYLLSCQHETRAKGSYTLATDRVRANGLAVVVPTDGGNARGGVLIEACIESHHKRAGTMPKAISRSEPAMTAKGKLAVPQGYNLNADERALWLSLTLEQQKRALAFLKSGSTIQSSLQED